MITSAKNVGKLKVMCTCVHLPQQPYGNFDRLLQPRGSKRPYFTRNPDELRISEEIERTNILTRLFFRGQVTLSSL